MPEDIIISKVRHEHMLGHRYQSFEVGSFFRNTRASKILSVYFKTDDNVYLLRMRPRDEGPIIHSRDGNTRCLNATDILEDEMTVGSPFQFLDENDVRCTTSPVTEIVGFDDPGFKEIPKTDIIDCLYEWANDPTKTICLIGSVPVNIGN